MVGRTLDWRDELGRFLRPFLDRLGHKARRRMCPLYVSGLIGPGDRKSIQPMAKRLALGECDQLHHFIAAGVWDAAPVETELLVQADRLVGGRDAVLVIDDTAIPKKGVQSVGVAAQYASALGKTANCQPCATLSSNSALDYRRSDARTVGNGFATNGGMSKSAKVVLASPLDNEQFKDELEDAIASLCRIRAPLGKGQQA